MATHTLTITIPVTGKGNYGYDLLGRLAVAAAKAVAELLQARDVTLNPADARAVEPINADAELSVQPQYGSGQR